MIVGDRQLLTLLLTCDSWRQPTFNFTFNLVEYEIGHLSENITLCQLFSKSGYRWNLSLATTITLWLAFHFQNDLNLNTEQYKYKSETRFHFYNQEDMPNKKIMCSLRNCSLNPHARRQLVSYIAWLHRLYNYKPVASCSWDLGCKCKVFGSTSKLRA